MGVIKGQNLRVMVGNPAKCVAMATNCVFHIATQLGDISTKDSDNDWQEQDVVGKSWDAQTDSLITLEDNGSNGELPQDLLSLILNSTPVTLTFVKTGGINNRVSQTSAITMTGTAYLTDLNFTAQNRANSQLSAKFTGTGPLGTV